MRNIVIGHRSGYYNQRNCEIREKVKEISQENRPCDSKIKKNDMKAWY